MMNSVPQVRPPSDESLPSTRPGEASALPFVYQHW